MWAAICPPPISEALALPLPAVPEALADRVVLTVAPAVLLPQGEFHRARGLGVQVGLGLLPGLCRLLPLRLGSLGLLLGRLRLLGLGGLACRALGGPCPGLAGLPFLRKVFPGGLLGGFHFPFGPLFRQDILQGKFLVVL